MIQVEEIFACPGPIKVGSLALDTALRHVAEQRQQGRHARATADADDVGRILFTKHKDTVRPFYLHFLTNMETAIQETRKSTTRKNFDDELKPVLRARRVGHRVCAVLIAIRDAD